MGLRDSAVPVMGQGGFSSIANAAGMTLEGLKQLFERLGEPQYRALQAFEGVYRHRWNDWAMFSNLPKALRERLSAEIGIRWPALNQSLISSDGSAKHRLLLEDCNAIECVYMPFESRATLCVSSQVGCALGCKFCATGEMGIVRNLIAAEIVGQAMFLATHHKIPDGFPINIVFMGMGEPMDNFAQVMQAFEILIHPKGMAIPPRRVTISTAGLVPGIAMLGGYSPRPRLALSLNATTDDARSKIMPINSAWGLEDLANALRSFPLERDERITLEYVLIKDISDTMDDASRLSKLAKSFPSKINLLTYNPFPGLRASEFFGSDESRLNEFGSYLSGRGHVVSIRRSRGGDIGGACGQLSGGLR
jgi:23S rRNA (adenine2503-C2)-methyltransferase